jgi:hypothetical protein
MNQEPMWQIVPREMTPEMEAAAKAAQKDGEDFAGQYRAALAAYAKATSGRKLVNKSGVSVERGEELLRDLQGGISSIAAGALFQYILTAEKRSAMAIMRDEHMSEQDADDLYAYCRTKWLKNRLVVVEVPRTRIAGFVQDEDARAQAANEDRPQYLVRQGLNISPCLVRVRGADLEFITSSGVLELKEVKQLWLVSSTS